MYSEYTIMKLDQERRDGCLKRGARERMLHSIRAGKPGLKCKVCGRLAALLARASLRLVEAAKVKPVEDIPAVPSLVLHRMLEETTESLLG